MDAASQWKGAQGRRGRPTLPVHRKKLRTLRPPTKGTGPLPASRRCNCGIRRPLCGGQNNASFEVGPALLLPNGTVFATGANSCEPGPHRHLHRRHGIPGLRGPDFPSNLDISDGPAALEPNGKMLMMASPLIFNAGSIFGEWDGSNLNQVSGPPNAPNVFLVPGTHCCCFPPGK